MKIIKPYIYIRADGSTQIGLGHIVRCSALAYMLKEDFEISFFCKEIPTSMQTELLENGFLVANIIDEEYFIEQLSNKAIVVLDGYGFDTDYQKKIKAKGCKLVCIDDMHDKEFVADLIINHAPGIVPQDYKAQSYTKFALGIEYTLLRPAFLEQAKKQRKIDKIETLLICYGGSDFKNLTQSTLKIALDFKEFLKIIVVTGSAYQISNGFLQLINSDKRIDYRNNLNEKQMLEAMLEADFAIVPASGILFEVLAAGCSVISGYYVENQKNIYDGFVGLNAIQIAEKFDVSSIVEAFKKNKLFNNSFVIDGRSNERILVEFNNLYK